MLLAWVEVRVKRLFSIISLALLLSQVSAPGVAAAATQRCFSHAIAYCISGAFKSYWEANGGLPAFGYPLSKVTTEKSSSGEIQVQWFERARMELHPESRPPYDVQLSVLGEMLLEAQGRDWRAASPGRDTAGCRFFAETARTLCEPFLSYYRSHGLQFDRQATAFSDAESLALSPASPAIIRRSACSSRSSALEQLRGPAPFQWSLAPAMLEAQTCCSKNGAIPQGARTGPASWSWRSR